MGTTLDDIAYDMYFEDMHEKYISTLEKFSKSRNIQELKDNLKEIRNVEEEISNNKEIDDNDALNRELADLKTIGDIYEKLIVDSEKSKRQFYVGLFLAFVGLVPMVINIIEYIFRYTKQ